MHRTLIFDVWNIDNFLMVLKLSNAKKSFFPDRKMIDSFNELWENFHQKLWELWQILLWQAIVVHSMKFHSRNLFIFCINAGTATIDFCSPKSAKWNKLSTLFKIISHRYFAFSVSLPLFPGHLTSYEFLFIISLKIRKVVAMQFAGKSP